jgi:N-acetylmuramoyl-L-alanine amidase
MLNIRKLISPNFNDRAGGVKPSILVLHYTGTDTAQEAEDYYMNIKTHAKAGPISPHYMIDYDGTVTQFVDEEKRAWHAGHSWWDGKSDINSHSIGIELVNPGHDRIYQPFTPAQMQSLAMLVQDILKRNDIPAYNIVGHSDIAPALNRNKPDPGENMDWEWLATQHIGLFPAPEQDDFDMADVLYNDLSNLRRALNEYGYDPRVTDQEAIAAFQRHFQPDAHHNKIAGIPDQDTAARLHWLLHQKNLLG